MKITICGSIAFFDEMVEIKNKLEKIGHEVKLPPTEIKDEGGNIVPVKQFYNIRKKETSNSGWVWDRKEEAMRSHFSKVEWSDCILVLNHDKNDIEGYVGANTLMEAGLAFHLNKRIFFLNKIPEISYKEEIQGMKPEIINGNLDLIK